MPAAPSPPSERSYPPAICQYWHGGAVPGDVDELVAGFGDLNPDFDHKVFDESGAERLIERHFGPRELAAFRACAVPAMQSDCLSYGSVLALGGVYADVDYRCLRPLGPLLDRLETGEIFTGPTVHRLNGRAVLRVWTGFFAFRDPGHPLLRLSLDLTTANIEARIADRVWGVGNRVREAIGMTTGPGVITSLYYMREWGSFDAFLTGIAGSFLEPFGKLFCEVVDHYDGLLEAFEGVRVSPHECMLSWVRDPERPLAYKETAAHWLNHRAAIFR